MAAPRADMHRLQELVRLHRLGTSVRKRAQLLGMSTRTEREYREAIAAAGLLEGAPDELPELAVLRSAVERQKPPAAPRPVATSVDDWMDDIRAAVGKGLEPQALWDKLRRDKPDEFKASLSAVKRAVLRVKRERGVQPEDVVIPIETAPGEVAQVDFGEVSRLFDPVTGKVRRAWVFVMVLGRSRHLFACIVFDQKVTTWLEPHVAAFE